MDATSAPFICVLQEASIGSLNIFLPGMFLASSTGLLLKTTGLKVTAIKIDPYMNIDAGTMAPTEHGEFMIFICSFICYFSFRAISSVPAI